MNCQPPAGPRRWAPMTWTQHYNPLGNAVLSTLITALPVLLGAIALGKMKIHTAALAGLAVAVLVALFAYPNPAKPEPKCPKLCDSGPWNHFPPSRNASVRTSKASLSASSVWCSSARTRPSAGPGRWSSTFGTRACSCWTTPSRMPMNCGCVWRSMCAQRRPAAV